MNNARYYISTGAKECFYTLRYTYTEVVHFHTEGGVSFQSVVRDYHIRNLSINAEEAVAKAKEITGQDLSATFDVNTIKRGEVDWSVLQGGKYVGKSIHEIRDIDANYLVWLCENMQNSKTYAKTVELAKALVSHELESREGEREQQKCAIEAKKNQIIVAMSEYANILSDGRNGFCDSIANNMRKGEFPSGRAIGISADIIAKKYGRRNSKSYNEAYDNFINTIEMLTK